MKYKTIDDVIAWRACMGCGICSYMAGEGIEMQNNPKVGFCPVRTGKPMSCSEQDLLAVCPGAGTVLSKTEPGPGISRDVISANGPTLEVWEGHAADEEIRFQGSSGGALTALSLFALEEGKMDGVLHIGGDENSPFLNKTNLSKSRQELLSRTGSRYSSTALCADLDKMNQVEGSCLVVGQPVEIAAISMAERKRPDLKEKVGMKLSFFCAGAPPAQATIELIKSRGIDPKEVVGVRYRGRGWPGHFAVWVKGKADPVIKMTYAESWAFLQKFRSWATHIWPDGSGEHADVTCGDPWYRKVEEGEVGSSLIVARTKRGQDFIRAAIEAGYLNVEPLSTEKLLASQKNLIAKKGAVWGRLWSMRILLIPTPEHKGYSLAKMWMKLSSKEKASSFLGTIRRLIVRKYYRPLRNKRCQ